MISLEMSISVCSPLNSIKVVYRKPTLTIRQLGSTIQWTLDPFSTVAKDNEYYCDFLFNKIKTDIEDQQNKLIKDKFLAAQTANKTTKPQSKANEQTNKDNKSMKTQLDTNEPSQNNNNLELVVKEQMSKIDRGGFLVPIRKVFVEPELEKN